MHSWRKIPISLIMHSQRKKWWNRIVESLEDYYTFATVPSLPQRNLAFTLGSDDRYCIQNIGEIMVPGGESNPQGTSTGGFLSPAHSLRNLPFCRIYKHFGFLARVRPRTPVISCDERFGRVQAEIL